MPGRQVGKQAWHTTYSFYYGKVRLTKTFKKNLANDPVTT